MFGIDKIDFSNLRKNMKWIIGYSDTTVLHSHLHRIGFATFNKDEIHELIRRLSLTMKHLEKVS